MQPRLTVGILILPSERLIRNLVNPLVLSQPAPAGVVAEPNQIAVDVGHLARYTELIAVEVVGLLAAFNVFSCPVAYLRQGFVCTAHALRQDWKFRAGYDLLTQSSGHFYYCYHCVSQYFFYVRIINLKFEIYSLSQGIF